MQARAFCLLLLVSGCVSKSRTISSAEMNLNASEVAQLARYSAAIYEDNDDALRKEAPDSILTVRTTADTHIRFAVLTDPLRRAQVLVIRGTANLPNGLLDAQAVAVLDQRLGILVHEGFGAAASEVFSSARLLLKADYDLAITGHSLGGAAAVLVGMLATQDGLKLSRVVTFGQPKVTDGNGTAKWKNLPLARVIHRMDPVAILPLGMPITAAGMAIGYQHFGTLTHLAADGSICQTRDPAVQERIEQSIWQTAAPSLIGWRQLQNPDGFIQQQVPDHFIKNYVEQLSLESLLPPSDCAAAPPVAWNIGEDGRFRRSRF